MKTTDSSSRSRSRPGWLSHVLSFVAVLPLACASEDDAGLEGDELGEELDFRVLGCEQFLITLRWTENPPFAIAGGPPVVARGELIYDAAAAGPCDMGAFGMSLENEPAINVIDDARELNGTLDPGETIPFEVTLKAKSDALADLLNAANTYSVGCGGDCETQVSTGPAELCVIPEAEKSLAIVDADGDLFIDGSCVGQACIPMPPGQLGGFGLNKFSGIHPFAGVLQPVRASFHDRVVQEQQLAPPTGTCGYFFLTGLTGPSAHVHGSIDGRGPDGYGPDLVGFFANPVAVLRQFVIGIVGCEVTIPQTMAMACPDGNFYPYETHDMRMAIDRQCDGTVVAGAVSVMRDDVCVERVWDPDTSPKDGIVDALASDADIDGDNQDNTIEDRNNNGDRTDDDTDADGIDDYLDWDDDGDNVPSSAEAQQGVPPPDSDGDGVPNPIDPDDDGDGTPTAAEDANGNGNPLDDDSDADGVPNYLDP